MTEPQVDQEVDPSRALLQHNLG